MYLLVGFIYFDYFALRGIDRMVPFNLKVLAKFGLWSNCTQKLDECSLTHARKTFATSRMLGISSIAKLRTLGKLARAKNVSGKMPASFC